MERVIDLIKYRRSIRMFEPKPLERDAVETLLEAARYAPSGHNKQSWLFTAITNPSILDQLNRLVREGFETLALTDSDPVELCDAKKKVQLQQDNYCFYYHAPCLIIASNLATAHNGRADCACALENMFLTSFDMGLGACWVNQLHWLDKNPKLRAYLEDLHIPPEHTICGSGVFGYPACPVPNPSPRKEGTWQIIE